MWKRQEENKQMIAAGKIIDLILSVQLIELSFIVTGLVTACLSYTN